MDTVLDIGEAITACAVFVLEHPNSFITVTVYVPELADVPFDIIGFCCDEVNPLGPLHENEAGVPLTLAFRIRSDPSQSGELELVVMGEPEAITTLYEVETAVDGDAHAFDEVIVTVIASPLLRFEELNVEVVTPVVCPFFFHK